MIISINWLNYYVTIYQYMKITYHNHDMEDYIDYHDIRYILHITSMYVRMYVCMYVHTYVCVFVMYVCMYVCVCTYVCVCMYVHYVFDAIQL